MRFRIGFARSGKCAISQCRSCRRLLQYKLGWCMWMGGGGRDSFRSSKCCCCFLQLLSCLVGGASCASMGSETRTYTNEMPIGCIVGGCTFQGILVPLLLSQPILHPDSVGQIYGNQRFPCLNALGGNLFCSCTISDDIGSRILAQVSFRISLFFFFEILHT